MTSAETPAPPPPLPVPLGTIIDGKYRVDEVIGSGAMGVVMAATHIALERKVAIKFLQPSMLDQREAVARFIREVRACTRLDSPHVARALDVGQLESGAPYLVIEHLRGANLEQLLEQHSPMLWQQAVDIVLQVLDAVSEAHAAGIVHRDLKPANIFIHHTPDGRLVAKVLDFGVSKIYGDEGIMGASLTKTSALVGSPMYMSPEQVTAAKQADGRADLWALGIVLYELIAGHPPFDGPNLGVLLTAVLTAPVVPLRTLRPEVPMGLERIVARCLERDLDRRYQTAAQLAEDLAPMCSEELAELLPTITARSSNASALTMTPPIALVTVKRASQVSALEAPPHDPRARTRGLLVALLIVVGLTITIAVAGWYAQQLSPSP